jgi:hypothetical protein
MRAKEFVVREAGSETLGNALRAMMAQSQQAKPGQPKDLNTTKTPQAAQAAQGTVAPSQATSGGTQTAQPAKKPGIIGSFTSGLASSLTGGQATSLGGAAKLGAAKLAGAAGLKTAQGDIEQNVANAEYQKRTAQSDVFSNPSDVGAAFKAGQKITLPNVGDITVSRVGPQGVELDTSKAPSIGVPKLTVNPKDLLKK